MNNRFVFKIIGALTLILVWQIAADIIGMEMLLASPFQVIIRLFTLVREPDFFTVLGCSCLRVFSGFAAAFLLGIILGGLSGRFRFFEDFLSPLMVVIKSVPIASFIVLLIIWFNNGITPIVTFLIAFPVIYGNVLQGVKSVDDRLMEVADIYRVSALKRICYIKIPAVSGYLKTASSTALGMAWKAGVAAELIGMVQFSIGDKFYDAKVNFQNEDLLAWTVVIILASIVFEKLFILLLNLFFRRFYKI